MKRVYFIFLAVLTLLVFASLSMATHHAVKIAQKDGVGKYLTDTEGKTLYYIKIEIYFPRQSDLPLPRPSVVSFCKMLFSNVRA